MQKAIIDFSGYTGPDLFPVAQTIADSLTTNAALFPDLPVALADFNTAITTYKNALAAKSSGAYADTMDFNLARHALEGDLGELGTYVNLVAQGNAATIMKSGFPSYDTAGHSPNPAPPAAPTNVVLRQGDLSGSFVARYHPDRPRSMNEVQTNIGDPNDEAAWKPAGMFSGGKATVGSIVPGSNVWVRIRTAGLKGVMGAWSDPAKIMVV